MQGFKVKADRTRQVIVSRSCDECQFWSDQQAKIAYRGHESERIKTVVARCLSKDGRYRNTFQQGTQVCGKFERGEPIDLPEAEPLKMRA